MRTMKRVGWILIGVVIGVLATSSIGAVKEQFQEPARLSVSYATANNLGAMAAFIKDTKSGGCWLSLRYGDSGVSLVTAPPSACE